MRGKTVRRGHREQAGSFGTVLYAMLVMLFAGSAWAAAPVVTYTDLYTLGKPAGFSSAYTGEYLHVTAGGQVVGHGGSPTGWDHALLWTPAAISGIDLNPSGFDQSVAEAIGGTQQVGEALVAGTVRQLACVPVEWIGCQRR